MDTVIYHANCHDGFCAAWLCHQHWPKAAFIPSQYGQNLPDSAYIDGKNVLVLDFSYPRSIVESMYERAESFLLLDHHETALKNLTDLPYCTLDNEKSGARLTWELLSKNLLRSKKIHWLVQYTEDRDLWKHLLPFTHEVNAAIRSYPLDFDIWDQLGNKSVDEVIQEGTCIRRYRNTLIKEHVKYARETVIDGYKAAIIQCTASELSSDIAAELLQGDAEVAIIVKETHDGKIYQLRSKDVDVSKIAEARGGGGHKKSAAFKFVDPEKCAVRRKED